MRTPLLLALAGALVLSGCTLLEKPAATSEPLDDADAPPVEPTPEAEPTPTTPAEPTPDPEPPEAPPENGTDDDETPDEPPAPVPPPDFHAEQEGWVERPNPEPFTARLAVPVQAGAKNVTVRVDLASVYPAEVPRQTANVTLQLLGADGKVLAETGRTALDESATVVLEQAGPLAVGEHQAVVTIVGASDGSSMGDRYRLVVHVEY